MSSLILQGIDSIVQEGLAAKAMPGCNVVVVRNGKMIFEKSYGYFTYSDSSMPVTSETMYDIASVTKTTATTIAIMKLYEQGKLNLDANIGTYLPWLKGSDKAGLLVKNLLMHQAGLNPFIPFYKEVIDKNGDPMPTIFSHYQHPPFNTTVSNNLYMRSNWQSIMYDRIKTSNLNKAELKYVYSDNDFILLGKIVEGISRQPLNEYVKQTFYDSLSMTSTGYLPFNHFALNKIAPTESEKDFRKELVWGHVHDPGAAMFGNVAGHAGIFSNAEDLAKLYTMLLNGGNYDGKQYLQKATIDFFTSYQTPVSRRGLGFDKPEKDNDNRTEDKAYPSKSVSPQTYGHTGFTGTCVWVDPKYNLIYIFLSNRVNPSAENNKLAQMNIRSRIQEVIYKAIIR